jgi:hypothetical protein
MSNTQLFVENHDWKGLVLSMNKEQLSDVQLDEHTYFLDDVVSNMSETLEKAKIEKFEDFVKEYDLIQQIKENEAFQYDSALLIFFLVRYHRNRLVSSWDFDTAILKRVFLQLGISTERFSILLADSQHPSR